MQKIAYLFPALLLLVIVNSCNSQNKTTISKVEEPVIIESDDAKMLSLGFKKATIKDFSKEEGCGYLIVLEENKQVLQPLKELELSYQKDGLKIWIKYRLIRPIAPACKKGQSIDVEEIKKA